MTDQKSIRLIPDRLLDEIRKQNCVLFLGADLRLESTHAPLSRSELAEALAKKYDLPVNLPWPDTAQNYLAKYPNDRFELVRFVKEQCSGPQFRPNQLHEAIAQTGIQAIVTDWYDELLEEALKQQGCRVHRVVRDKQLPFIETGEREVFLIKLYGCVSDPESLVLTRWDINRLSVDLSQKLKFIAAFCSTKPLLFINHNLRDPVLQQLYAHASKDAVEYMRRSYAVWPSPDETMRSAWMGLNLELLDRSPIDFLVEMKNEIETFEKA